MTRRAGERGLRRAWWPLPMVLVAALLQNPRPAQAVESAPELFGAVVRPTAERTPRVIGGYALGCVEGTVALPADGPGWQVMRLSRNRYWGHPELVAAIDRLAEQVQAAGQPGLLVGDLGQPRGGPMRSGHASHQVGLDADIWLTPMPSPRLDRPGREALSAVSMIAPSSLHADPQRLGAFQETLIRTAAELREVSRIFVAPGIKEALCARAKGERGWLGKVRPWYGHTDHMHLRLHCPQDQPLCKEQDPPPVGDGCDGKELAWWFSDEPYAPRANPLPAPPIQLSSLPPQCRGVLSEP